MKMSKIALIALAAASFGLASSVTECISECSGGNIGKISECVSSCAKLEIEKKLNGGIDSGSISGGLLINTAKEDPCGYAIIDRMKRGNMPIPPALLKAAENCPYPR